jgi:hypothetical protein
MKLLRGGRLTNFTLTAHHQESSIFERHEVRSIEVIRHEDPEHDTHHNRWDTFNDEDPSPGSIPTNTIHEADSIRNETSNGTGNGGSDEQVPDSKSDGSLVVEESQICDEAGEEASFEETEEDTACQ